MSNFKQLEAGEIFLVMQEPDGRICQIAITEEQHVLLKSVLAAMSKEKQFVKMPEEYDMVLKSTIKKK